MLTLYNCNKFSSFFIGSFVINRKKMKNLSFFWHYQSISLSHRNNVLASKIISFNNHLKTVNFNEKFFTFIKIPPILNIKIRILSY